MNINEMTKQQLEDLQVQKEQELREGTESIAEIELAINDIGRQIDELRLKKRGYEDGRIKGKSNLRRVSSELRAIRVMIYKRLQGL